MASDRDVVVRIRVDARGVREALLGLSARRPPKWLARWLRALRRYPRLVSYGTYCKATKDAPSYMRRHANQRKQTGLLLAAHGREKQHHRAAIDEKEDLKAILARVAPFDYALWIAARRRNLPLGWLQ